MPTKSKHTISVSADIPAPPQEVYRVLADYQNGHPHILPKAFSGMTVEKGGIGAGTIIRFQMQMLGRKQSFRAAITEPEPERILVETDLGTNGAVTTFTVDPGPAPGQSHLTIKTELPVRDGIAGAIERFLSTRLLHPLDVREMAILARFVTQKPATPLAGERAAAR